VSRTNSPIGRNATFCSLRYDTSIDNLFDTTLSSRYCYARFQSALSTYLLARANALREIILVRDGIFALSNANHLTINDLNYIIESLAVDLNLKKLIRPISLCMELYICMYMYLCVCVVYICVCLYVCVCIYILYVDFYV